METIYYLTSVLLVLGLPALLVGMVVYLIRPSLLNKSKYITNPVSRGKIAGIGLTAFVVAIMGFGSVLSATEPATVRQDRLSREAAAKDAELKKQQAVEQDRLKQIEAAKPKVKLETKIEPIAFESIEQEDATIPKGERRVANEGVNGERTITYDVTYLKGKEVNRSESKNDITLQPIHKVTLVGTYVAPPPKPVPAPTPPSVSSGVVKMSRTGICHAPGTTYYNQTLHYDSYPSLDGCLNAGGRLPKR